MNEQNTDQEMLERINRHFAWRKAQVLADDTTLRLLAVLYEKGAIDKNEFDGAKWAFPLARLAAANMCEVGAAVVSISEFGQFTVQEIMKMSSPGLDNNGG